MRINRLISTALGAGLLATVGLVPLAGPASAASCYDIPTAPANSYLKLDFLQGTTSFALRSGPSTSCSIADTVRRGDRIQTKCYRRTTYLGETWSYVIANRGSYYMYGWIRDDYLLGNGSPFACL